MEDKIIPTLLVEKNTREIYRHHGENKYANLTTGKNVIILPEHAAKYLKIPLVLNAFVIKNPLIIDLIKMRSFYLEGVSYDEPTLKEFIKQLD